MYRIITPIEGMPCRLGHDTKHFNVGQYRRVQKTASEVQDASFFDPNNEVASHLCYSLCLHIGSCYLLAKGT